MSCYTNLLFGHEKIVDNFAGGGGASEGIEQGLGRPVDLAINHDPIALAIHAVNHPSSEHAVADVWDINPEEAVADMPVGLAWFSPDCRHHSKAKGGSPLLKQLRGLAWVAARWAARVKPRCIVIENVDDMRRCGYNGWAQGRHLEAELAVIREKSMAVVQHWAAAEQGEIGIYDGQERTLASRKCRI